MKKGTVLIVHVIFWLLTSVLYFFLSEKITAAILPGVHDVTTWLKILAVGQLIILLATVTSLIMKMKSIKNQGKTRHEKLDAILRHMASDLKEIPTRPNQIAERAGLDIESQEAYLMLDMMYKDGYVSKQGDNPFYEILYKGLIFLDNGGYTRDNHIAKRQLLAKKISDYVDIVVKPVGIITALAITTWTIIQIIKFFTTPN